MDKKSRGFTLIEVIVVIVILGIIVAVVVPILPGFKNKTEERVCNANMKTVERMYSTFLVENNLGHLDSIFNQFLINNFGEVCPAGGVIAYEDEKVKCSVHGNEEQATEDEVPWL